MSIAIGTRLGQYEITGPLGSGGMGVVYRGRDIRLDRLVAIKVLSAALAGDPGFRDRFEREARAISALNHPNIAQLYALVDLPRDTALQGSAMVMELIDGESLDGLIARRTRVPASDAFRIARQIADALEAAHDRGIIHRDLKPANIFITPSGQVKVLDFGLAKVLGPGTDVGATLSAPGVTAAGVVIGTAAYMSPEQARGLAVDRRADVWAFGCVLYELLTGTRAFDGPTISDSLAALLMKDPDWTALPPDTGTAVRRLLRRTLEKDPSCRLRDIADARLELDEIVETATASPAPAVAVNRRGRSIRYLAFAAAALAACVATGVAVWKLRPRAAAPVTRFSIDVGTLRFSGTQRAVLALTPDGRSIAFSSGTPPSLYVRRLDSLTPEPVRGSEGPTPPTGPVFSPDGQSLIYWISSEQALKRIAVAGGAPLTLCQTELPSGVTWTNDGIVFANSDGIYRISPDGGRPELLQAAVPGEIAFWPQLLPGGRTLLFTTAEANGGSERWDSGRAIVQTVGDNQPRVLIEGATDSRYIASGHIVFGRRGVVYAVPFDASTLRVTGREVAVLEGVMRGTGTYGSGTVNMAISQSGALAYLPGPLVPVATKSSIAAFDLAGGVQPLPIPLGSYNTPRVSRDGRRIAFIVDDGKDVDVWIYDMRGAGAPRRLTFAGHNRSIAWTADGERVAYRSDRAGPMSIYWQRADGTGAAERLTTPEAGAIDIPNSFSPDGQWLLFDRIVAGRTTLSLLSMANHAVSGFDAVESSNWTGAAFSPDGHWVAYARRERGKSNQVFIEPFPATGAKYLLSRSDEDAHHPAWAPDGRFIVYTPGPGLPRVRVPVSFEGGVSFGTPTPLEQPFSNLAGTADRPYDMMSDGRHILSVTDPLLADDAMRSMVVVLNWFEELKLKVAAGAR